MSRTGKQTLVVGVSVAVLVGVPLVSAVASSVDDFAGGAEAAAAAGQRSLDDTGNMIFIHPDGTDAAYWEAGRIYWDGPDAVSQWDLLPEMTVYRGHMADQLEGTSNGGATVHAFGYKVDGPGSYGTDSGAEDVRAGDAEAPRAIDALSGYSGSWLREAGNAGHPIGIINDGDIAEPGTGAFLAEVATRDDPNGIVAQIITGRPGFGDDDQDPVVVLGGGEENFLPEGTRYCTDRQIRRAERRGTTIPLRCLVHRPAGATLTDEVPATGGTRTDGVNLLRVASREGYTVVRTRAEFERLRDDIADGTVDPAGLKVLGLFADEDVFNDEPEESLIDRGLVDESVPAEDKRTNLVLWGSEPGTPGYHPPTPAELNELGLTVLQAHAERSGRPFGLVSEVESTDNFGNTNNGIGALTALHHANGVIGAARDFQADHPRTLVLTAADSAGGAPQVYGINVDEEIPATVGSIGVNPTGLEPEGTEPPQNPLDGRYGRETAPFVAAPDQFGQELPFGLAWTGGPDFNGGIVTRAQGLNAELLGTTLFDRFDNVDVYRMAYLTLFGEALDYPTGRTAPTRGAPLVDVQLLALNDFHGALEPPSGSGARVPTGPAVDGAPAPTVDAGGAEYLATQLAELAAEQDEESTITVAAGDLIGATPLLSAAFHDEPTIESLGLAGLDYASVGNHEFDEGSAELLRIQNGGCHPVDGCADGTPYAGADFRYLSANAFVSATGEPLLAPYAIHETQGVRIGFIGMTLEGTADIVSQQGVAGLDFADEVETANRYAAELQGQGVEAIVVLLHQGGTQTGPDAWDVNGCSELTGPIVDLTAGMSDAIDVVVSGHTHQAYNCDLDGTLVTSAGSNGRLVTDIDLTVDRRTGDVAEAVADNVIVTRDVAADAAQTELIARYREVLGPIADEVVGETAVALTRDAETLFPGALGESALGDVIADAQLAATDDEAGAVAALMNPGGVRADLDAGPVTYEEAFTVQPFANNLVTLDLTGAQLQCVLEQQFQVGRTLYPSVTLTYAVDPAGTSAPADGDPCTGTRVPDDGVAIAGTPVDPAATYRVTVNSFLAGGGDGFTTLTAGTNPVTGPIDLDALVAYLGANSPVAAPTDDRISAVG